MEPNDDLLEIPAFLRRQVNPSMALAPVAESLRGFALPTIAVRPSRKRPGVVGRLRQLGWRPCDIRRMSRDESEQRAALGKTPTARRPG